MTIHDSIEHFHLQPPLPFLLVLVNFIASHSSVRIQPSIQLLHPSKLANLFIRHNPLLQENIWGSTQPLPLILTVGQYYVILDQESSRYGSLLKL